MKKWIVTGAVLMSVCGAQAQTVLASWDATPPATTYPTLAVVSNAANLSAGAVSAVGLTADSADSYWAWYNFSMGTSPDPGRYWEFTLTPAAGKKIAVTGFGFRLDYGSASYGPTSWVLQTSADGFATNAAQWDTVRSVSPINYTVTIAGVTNQMDALTLRVYGFNNNNNTSPRRCGIDAGGPAEGDVYVKGSISDSGTLPGTLCIVK